MFGSLRVFVRYVVKGEVPARPVVVEAADPTFGSFVLTGWRDPRKVTVTGPLNEPVTLTVVRQVAWQPKWFQRLNLALAPLPKMHPSYGDSVALDVGGKPAPLDCGRPFIRRRAQDIRATVSGREYMLRHCGPREATLERDGDSVVDLFRRRLFPKPGKVIRDYAPAADALDATIAVAFGNCLRVGAPSAASNLNPF